MFTSKLNNSPSPKPRQKILIHIFVFISFLIVLFLVFSGIPSFFSSSITLNRPKKKRTSSLYSGTLIAQEEKESKKPISSPSQRIQREEEKQKNIIHSPLYSSIQLEKLFVSFFTLAQPTLPEKKVKTITENVTKKENKPPHKSQTASVKKTVLKTVSKEDSSPNLLKKDEKKEAQKINLPEQKNQNLSPKPLSPSPKKEESKKEISKKNLSEEVRTTSTSPLSLPAPLPASTPKQEKTQKNIPPALSPKASLPSSTLPFEEETEELPNEREDGLPSNFLDKTPSTPAYDKDTECINFIDRLTRILSKFPGKKSSCTIRCTYSISGHADKIDVSATHPLSPAYQAHIIATLQRTSSPRILHGKTVKIIM